MNEIFEKIYNNNNTSLNEDTALFEKVYMEVKMLNEMNPKLRALLAAGLIGTAGLGAVSCSMPTDDPYDAQYTIEQPTPENPEEIEEIEDSEDSEENTDSEEITDSEDSEDFEDPGNPENPEEIEEIEDSENPVTFETLGVSDEDAKSLSRAKKSKANGIVREFTQIGVEVDEQYNKIDSFIYKNNIGFVPVEFENNQYEDGQTYIRYKDKTHAIYYVLKSMGPDFDQAIDTYKATHIE